MDINRAVEDLQTSAAGLVSESLEGLGYGVGDAVGAGPGLELGEAAAKRVKGFAAVSGKPLRLLIQAVGPRVDAHYDRPFSAGEPRLTRLVVIGETGIDREAVTASLLSAAQAKAA